MQPYLLGIDIGTGSTKAVATFYNGKAFESSQHYYLVKTPQPGYSEQDPEVIFDAFKSCIADVVKRAGYAPAAISLSSAMHSLISVNEDGRALTDMMTWADSRSEDQAGILRNSAAGEAIYRTSGTPIHAMSPLCKILWLRSNNELLFKATFKFISIKEYIWYRIFNVFEIDYSIASATGLFDIEALKWNPEACALAGITPSQLSVPVDTIFQRSNVHSKHGEPLGINSDTIFVIGASDGCCANLGSFVLTPDTASLTIGTSGAVRITSPVPVFNYGAMVFNYLLYKDTYVCGGAINNGGIILNWLVKSFMDKSLPGHNEYDNVFKAIEQVQPGSEGLLFLPYLYGERAPIWDTKSCGVFFNIKPQHTQAHFLRAGLEGLCFALNNVVETIESASKPITRMHISGGFISSPVWTQILADITGKELIIMQQEDASAIGAVFLAVKALGINTIGEPGPATEQVVTPKSQNLAVYKKRFLLFKQLYQDLKATMHQAHLLDKN